MLKSLAIPSFFSFYFGASLAFWLNIDSANMAIMTAALIAALLTYYSSLVTVHNKNKDYREKVIESIVVKGREFIKKSIEIRVEALAYMPLKKGRERDIDTYEDYFKKLKASVEDIKAKGENKEGGEAGLTNAYKEIVEFQDKFDDIYQKVRSDYNEKVVFFQRSEIECKNMGEDFLDEADAIDYLYYDEKAKSSEIYNIVLDIIKNLMVIIDNAKNRNIYNIDSLRLNIIAEKEMELRNILSYVKEDCLMETSPVDKKNSKERDVVFILSVVVFLTGIGFMVSNGFKS